MIRTEYQRVHRRLTKSMIERGSGHLRTVRSSMTPSPFDKSFNLISLAIFCRLTRHIACSHAISPPIRAKIRCQVMSKKLGHPFLLCRAAYPGCSSCVGVHGRSCLNSASNKVFRVQIIDLDGTNEVAHNANKNFKSLNLGCNGYHPNSTRASSMKTLSSS